MCRCGAFSVPRFDLVLDLVLDLVFFLYQNPSCSIKKLGKGPASRFCLWASTVPTKKWPVGNRRSDGIRSKTNRTMIVWSRLVKAFPMGKGVLQGLCRDRGRGERFDWE